MKRVVFFMLFLGTYTLAQTFDSFEATVENQRTYHAVSFKNFKPLTADEDTVRFTGVFHGQVVGGVKFAWLENELVVLNKKTGKITRIYKCGNTGEFVAWGKNQQKQEEKIARVEKPDSSLSRLSKEIEELKKELKQKNSSISSTTIYNSESSDLSGFFPQMGQNYYYDPVGYASYPRASYGYVGYSCPQPIIQQPQYYDPHSPRDSYMRERRIIGRPPGPVITGPNGDPPMVEGRVTRNNYNNGYSTGSYYQQRTYTPSQGQARSSYTPRGGR